MYCPKNRENCKVCNGEPYWKVCLKDFTNALNWDNVEFFIIRYLILYLLFGWWGIAGGFIFDWIADSCGTDPLFLKSYHGEPIIKHTDSKICKLGTHTNCLIVG